MESISQTAFVVAHFRSNRPEISGDLLASWWQLDARQLATFAEESEKDNLQVCVRSRFFLEAIREFVETGGGRAVLLLGAGLSSYAYLFDNDALWFEVDLAPMVRFKEKRAAALTEQGVLPPRDVRYLPADLSIVSEMTRVLAEFARAAVGRRGMIVAEGLLYYLSAEAESEVLARCGQVQSPGDLLALDIWPVSAVSNATYQQWQADLNAVAGNPATRLSDPAVVGSVPGYRVKQHFRDGQFARERLAINFDTASHIPTELFVMEHD